MAVELQYNTVYQSPVDYEQSQQSLLRPGHRTDFARVKDGSLVGALNTVDNYLSTEENYKLSQYGSDTGLGRNRILRLLHGTLHLPNFGREAPTTVRLGVALDCDINRGVVPRRIIVRESLDNFHTTDFVNGARGLLQYNDRVFKLPVRLRDKAAETGVWTGIVTGAGSGGALALYNNETGYMLGGLVVLAVILGATAGGVAGYCFENQDDWDARQVPFLNEYTSNRNALRRLTKIASHIETVSFLRRVRDKLRDQGVKLSEEALLKNYWQQEDPEKAWLIGRYNSWLNDESAKDEQEKAVMVDLFANYILKSKF